MNKPKFETPDLTAENVSKIAELFPGVVTEGKVNFDLLRSMLGDEICNDIAKSMYICVLTIWRKFAMLLLKGVGYYGNHQFKCPG